LETSGNARANPADIPIDVDPRNVRYWHKADIVVPPVDVRFRGKNGHHDLTRHVR
jgi:hypothetical protein